MSADYWYRSYEPRDTLRPRRLPSDEAQLQYRPDTDWRSAGVTLAGSLVFFPLLAVFIVLMARWMSHLVVTPTGFTLFFMGTVLPACLFAAMREELKLVAFVAISGPLLWGCIAVFSQVNSTLGMVILLTVVFSASIWLADRVVYFYVRWRIASPTLTPKTKEQLWGLLAERGKNGAYQRATLTAVALTAVAILLAFILIPAADVRPQTAAVLFLCLTCVFALVAFLDRLFHPRRSNKLPKDPTRYLFLRALSCWLLYQRRLNAPGVFYVKGWMSSATVRYQVFATVTAFLAAVLATSSYYAPLSLVSRDKWQQVVLEDVPEELSQNPFDYLNASERDEYQMMDSSEQEQYEAQLRGYYEHYFSIPVDQRQEVFDVLSRGTPYYDIFSRMPHAQVQRALSPEDKQIYPFLTEEQQAEFDRTYIAVRREDRSKTEFGKLNSTPESWIPFAMSGILVDFNFFVWTFFFAGLQCAVSPAVIFLSLSLIVTRPLLHEMQRLCEDDPSFPTRWDGYVFYVQNSPVDEERTSLFLGINEYSRCPVLLPASALREHAHILGDTGSGKTAMALAPMMSQLIRMSARNRDEEEHRQQEARAASGVARSAHPAAEDDEAEDQQNPRKSEPPHSVVVIDLKGDKALFEGARLEASRRNLQFRWFTNLSEQTTHVFNPFQQSHFPKLTADQKAEVLLESLGLSHGEDYGRSFFSRANRRVMIAYLAHFGDLIQSFGDLARFVADPKSKNLKGKELESLRPDDNDTAQEVLATINLLARFPQLNVTPQQLEMGLFQNPHALDAQIDMLTAFRTPQVIYFYLPAAIGSSSVREIGKLALFSLLSASIVAETESKKRRLQVYLFVDEFQQIVSDSLEVVLRQARSKNIACVLANQTISDLRSASSNLIPTVQANTRLKQFFASTDLLQQDDLTKASGETIEYLAQWSVDAARGPLYHGEGEPEYSNPKISEHTTTRIRRNDIIRVTDDETLSIAHLSRSAGYAQFGGFPFELRGDYHITQKEYQRREQEPWPPETEESIIVTLDHLERQDELLARPGSLGQKTVSAPVAKAHKPKKTISVPTSPTPPAAAAGAPRRDNKHPVVAPPRSTTKCPQCGVKILEDNLKRHLDSRCPGPTQQTPAGEQTQTPSAEDPLLAPLDKLKQLHASLDDDSSS